MFIALLLKIASFPSTSVRHQTIKGAWPGIWGRAPVAGRADTLVRSITLLKRLRRRAFDRTKTLNRAMAQAANLVHSNGLAATAGTDDPGLVALLVTARRWWDRLATGETDRATLSGEEGVNESWMSRVIQVNLLSHRIIDAIITGTQPVNLTARRLRRNDLPQGCDEQGDLLAS